MLEAGKVVVVTGASRGIGAATALLAAQRGYAVCVNYRSNAIAARAVVSEIESAGGKAIAVQADISIESDVVRLFESCDASFGPLTALVNNAGVLEMQMRVEQMDAARLTRILAMNVIGSFLCAREAIKRMSTRNGGRGGSIVNVCSAAARRDSANESVDYASTRGAIDAMTIGLAKEVAADGIRINGARPGSAATALSASSGVPNRVEKLARSIPLRPRGPFDDIAETVLWLLSDEAGYTTGALLDVAGGK